MIKNVAKIKKKSTKKPNKTKGLEHEDLTCSWTIRGISIEARSAANKAAERGHEFTGSWVSRKLLEAAQEDLTSKREIARPEDVAVQEISNAISPVLDKMSEKIEKLTETIEGMQRRRSLLRRWIGR